MINVGAFPSRFSVVLLILVSGITFLLTACAVPDKSVSGDKQPVINKGLIDQREYHYLTLPNQLKVLLISDKNADKAAASLDVNVGSSDDPLDRAGLAHFLEHMLFLGTEKYPNAADYQAFIDHNGGGHNAYTSAEHTNYFFDINANQLEEALDRFSQFFIAPLFDELYVARERNAVHSEYQSKIKNDYRRGYDVYRQMINPDHPYSKFSVGSLTTLADRPDSKVRDDLLAFYDKHYSSDKMTLVVLGKESIPELQHMVEQRFAQIPQRNVTTKRVNVPLFTDHALPLEVLSQPVQNIRQMSMTFPLPSAKSYYAEKPLKYIGFLLGHEGQGSVLSVLKERGWAEGLSAGGSDAGAGNSMFYIVVNLTEEGVKQRDKIRSLIFHALDTIREQGVEAWRYQEEQQLANVSFQYREQGRAINTVSGLASNLHDYPVSEVISADYLYSGFDADLIQRFLADMTPENLYVSTVFPEAKTDKVTHYYQVPYGYESLANSIVDISSELKEQYQLPKENIFIPESSQLFADDQTLEQPVSTVLAESIASETDKNDSVLWVKQDRDFGVPKAIVSLRLQSPLMSQTVVDSAKGQLLIELIKDRLNENSYPALIAGLSYSFDANTRGFDVHLSGYDNKMDLLLGMVMNEIQQPTIKPDRFNNIKAELLRQLHNTKKKTPFRQLLGQLPVTLFHPYWSDEQISKEMEVITFDELQVFAQQWLKGSSLKGLFYGNINQALIYQWKEKITPLIVDGKKKLASAQVVNLSKTENVSVVREETITVDHSDKAVALYVQGETDTLEDQAKMVLLRQVLESNFYTQLRTEQQLGYIVFLTSLTIKEVPGSAFVVQSPNTSIENIKTSISTFLTQSAETIPNDLSLFKRSAATQLLEKPQQLSAQGRRYWDSILKGDDSFNYRSELVEEIQKIPAQALRDYYQQTLLNKQRLLWFVADDKISRDNETLFSESLPYYSYP